MHHFAYFLRNKVGKMTVGAMGCLAMMLALVPAVHAEQVTYTAVTITDGQLGHWQFHNARVILRFDGDTNNVQFMQVPDPTDPTNPLADIAINTMGVASVTIATARRTVHATFAANQIFVSLDRGSIIPGVTNFGARGVGFGYFSPSSQGGVEVAYPLGIEDGTIDWGDAASPSAELQNIPLDLQNSGGYSGRAWVCLGFPNETCPTPTQGLHTDHGDLFLYQPYFNNFFGDTIQGGFFVTDVGGARRSSLTPPLSAYGTKPITYNAYVISDASLGGVFYPAAQVYLSFEADASKVTPYNDSSGHGFINSVGRAQVTIINGRRTATAFFAPNQLYVYFDVTHASIGFGSNAGGRGYPLSLTSNQDSSGLVENSSIGAISDILTTPADAANYTTATAGLVTDLTNATALSGAASSCVGFDPSTTICSNLTPIPLATSRGAFLLYEPFTDDETTTNGTAPFSVNWGLFWSDLGVHED
jgi:hypothetical protein